MTLDKLIENESVQWAINWGIKLFAGLGLGFTVLLWLQKFLGLTLDFSMSLGL